MFVGNAKTHLHAFRGVLVAINKRKKKHTHASKLNLNGACCVGDFFSPPFSLQCEASSILITATEVLGHEACVRLLLVQGEMDLTWREGHGKRGGMEWAFCLTALSSCLLQSSSSLFAFLVLKRNILFLSLWCCLP